MSIRRRRSHYRAFLPGVETLQKRAAEACLKRKRGYNLLKPDPRPGYPPLWPDQRRGIARLSVWRGRGSPLMMLFVAWGAITLVLVVLLIYRSTLTMHEDDQLFLDDSSMHMQEEQIALQKRMSKIQPFLR